MTTKKEESGFSQLLKDETRYFGGKLVHEPEPDFEAKARNLAEFYHQPGCPTIADDESDYEYLSDAGECACGVVAASPANVAGSIEVAIKELADGWIPSNERNAFYSNARRVLADFLAAASPAAPEPEPPERIWIKSDYDDRGIETYYASDTNDGDGFVEYVRAAPAEPTPDFEGEDG